MTSALRGEGVSFMTRSLASVLAYDSTESVVVVDLNFTDPPPQRKRRGRRQGSVAPPPITAQGAAVPAPTGTGEPNVDALEDLEDLEGPDDVADGDDVDGDDVDDVDNDEAGHSVAEPASDAALPVEPKSSVRPTLAEAVERGAPIDELFQTTSNPRLALVTAGVVPRPRRPAMAGSQGLELVIGKIADRFDRVLLDLPPVLASSDAITLSQLAEGFLFVVQQGSTSTTQVEAAMEELSSGVPIGVILNRFDSHIPRMLQRLVGV